MGRRRCPGRPGPSTALRGRAAPRRASRLLPRPLLEPRAPDRVPGNDCPEPAGSETTPQAGTRATTGRANTQGRRPGGSASVAGRREPPIYPRCRGTHPTDRAQDFAAVTSTPFPPKLPHTHTHAPGHFRAALGPAHPLPLLGRTWRFISLPRGSRGGRNRERAPGDVGPAGGPGGGRLETLGAHGVRIGAPDRSGIPASLISAYCWRLGRTRANTRCG